jgi:hypothetical protein
MGGCIPVLKGGTLPSLLAQKLSAWYSAYSGVLLSSLFGLFLSIFWVVDHCQLSIQAMYVMLLRES